MRNKLRHLCSTRGAKVVVVTLAWALAPQVANVGGAEPIGDRRPDPIILMGEALGESLLGRPVDSLRLLARTAPDGALAPIPFQIDERDADGRLVLTAGPAAAADSGDRHLDGNDELVFLARDAGARAADRPAGVLATAEIRLTDPRTGQQSWAYLAAYPPIQLPPLSPVRYVRFDPVSDRITTSAYHLRFTDSARPFTVTWASTPNANGPGTDFLDSIKVRLTGRLFGLKTITKTEADFDAVDGGHLLGPIRLVRVTKTRLRLIGRLSAAGADVIRIYYPDWVESPVPISLPFGVSAVFSDTNVFYGSDFDLPRDGSHRYYSERFPEGIPIDESVGFDVTASAQPEAPVAWHGIAGPLGSIITAVRLPESAPVSVETVFRISDESDEPEDVRGASPLVGRRLLGWDRVPSGRHVVYFYDFFPAGYQPGDEQKFMRMLSDPITTTVLPSLPGVAALSESRDPAISIPEG